MTSTAVVFAFPEMLDAISDRRRIGQEDTDMPSRDSIDRRSTAGGERVSDELLGEVRQLLQRDKTDHGARLISAGGIAVLCAVAIWTVVQVQDMTKALPAVSAFMVATTATLAQQSSDIRQLQLTAVSSASKDDLAREITRLQVDIQGSQTRLTLLEQALKRR